MLDLVVLVLRLQELVEHRDHVAIDVVGPQAAGRPGLRVRRQEVLAGVQVLEVLHDYGGFVGAPCWTVADGGNEAAWVDVKQGLRLLVGVYFDVLVWNGFVFQGYPNTLDKGACNY